MARRFAFVAVLVGSLLAVAAPAGAADAILVTRLTGADAVPPGDPDGSGSAVLFVDDDTNQVCALMFVRGIEPATAAHVHIGVTGQVGGHAVDLEPPSASGFGFSCGRGSEPVIALMTTEPHRFYLNIHNQPYPDGALRGQLGFS